MSKIIKEEKRSVITEYGEIKYTLLYKDVKNLTIKFKIDKGVIVTINKNSNYLKAENFVKEKSRLIWLSSSFLFVLFFATFISDFLHFFNVDQGPTFFSSVVHHLS